MSARPNLRRVFAGRRVLITGGLGFIGSNLARALVGLGARVSIVDSLVPEYGGNRRNLAGIAARVKVHVADVRDWPRLPDLVRGQDFLFNLAGQTSHMDSMTDPQTDLDINCRAQLAILEACRLHNPGIRIVFASTRQIYGRPDYLPVDERHPLRPVDVNGINKMAGEAFHLLYSRVHGIAATALRLTNTIGPRMRVKDARQTFVGVWVRRLVEGEPFEVWGGEQLRDFTYVDDAVEAFLLAAAKPEAVGEVFNSIWDCKALIEQQLIDYIRTTVVHAGGITHLRRIADLAALYQVRTGCHGATDLSPVCMGAALHFGLWVPNFGIQEHMPHTPETDAVFPHSYRFERGFMHPGEVPGHGVEIDEALAARYPYQRAYLPVNRLQHDGTLWHW